MRVDRLGFGLVLSALTATPSFGGPAVASRYNEIKMSQEQCLKNAETALRNAGLDRVEQTGQSRYGTHEDYTGVVRCIASNGLVLFIASGPARPASDNLAGTLFKTFEGGLH
jgi:hypothetical protein